VTTCACPRLFRYACLVQFSIFRFGTCGTSWCTALAVSPAAGGRDYGIYSWRGTIDAPGVHLRLYASRLTTSLMLHLPSCLQDAPRRSLLPHALRAAACSAPFASRLPRPSRCALWWQIYGHREPTRAHAVCCPSYLHAVSLFTFLFTAYLLPAYAALFCAHRNGVKRGADG